MGLPDRVRAFLAHTRFVPTPVYRLMVLAWAVSGLLQILYGAPSSVRQTAPPWFDWAFVVAQLLSSTFVLVGLYYVEENLDPTITEDEALIYNGRLRVSLTLELMGIIGLQTVVAVQMASVWFDYGRPPAAGTSWMAILFALYLCFRERDILTAQRKLAP